MDYSEIEILNERRGTLYSFEAISKIERMLFSLSLYPDWRMASRFADVKNRRAFLPYWLGKKQYKLLLKNVKERRKVIEKSDENLFVILENTFAKYQTGGNYLSPFLTDDEVLYKEISEPITTLTQEAVLTAMGLNQDWSYLYILENIDTLIAIEKTRKNLEFDTGKYWIVSYSQIPIKSIIRPFALLARVQEENNNLILYVQGAWPVTYMKNALDRMVPMPYEATLEDIRYMCVQAEVADSGPFKIKYKIEKC